MHPNWRTLATANISWKQFVREGTADKPTSKRTPGWDGKIKATPLTGSEAKKTYEDVVGTSSLQNDQAAAQMLVDCKPAEATDHLNTTIKQEIFDSDDDSYVETKSTSTLLPITQTDINNLMKSAQENDTTNVSKTLAKGVDINVTDQFGWTALMCASCSGALDVVQQLLDMGADLNVRDKKYDSCLTLAKQKGHTAIVKVLKDCIVGNRASRASSSSTREKPLEKFHCDVCKRDFCETTRKQHLSSMVHLFNSRPKPFGTVYGISEANKGYQILLKNGWDKEKGLGPDGTGHKFPCKTVLKRDRTGIGKTQTEPRVTHFGPREKAAVSTERKPRETDKRLRNKRISDDKRKDMKLRRELS